MGGSRKQVDQIPKTQEEMGVWVGGWVYRAHPRSLSTGLIYTGQKRTATVSSDFGAAVDSQPAASTTLHVDRNTLHVYVAVCMELTRIFRAQDNAESNGTRVFAHTKTGRGVDPGSFLCRRRVGRIKDENRPQEEPITKPQLIGLPPPDLLFAVQDGIPRALEPLEVSAPRGLLLQAPTTVAALALMRI